MKKALAYILIPLFLFNTSMGELFKLPVLFAHYSEHQRLNSDLDLLGFIGMHYGGTDNNNRDNDRDEQLPFKKSDAPSSYQLLLLSTHEQEPLRLVADFSYSIPAYKSAELMHPSFGRLLRPPRC